MYDSSPGEGPETLVVRAGTTGKVFCGSFAFFWAVPLVAIDCDPTRTASNRIEAGAFFGFFILLGIGLWFLINRRRAQLEIRRIDIVNRLVIRPQGKPPQRVNRADGDLLHVLPKFKLYGKVRQARLVFLGRGEFILLKTPWEGAISAEEVRRAGEARGWPFGGDPSLAVKDVQIWLQHGRSFEAAQLLEVFGPFPAAATDGEPRVALAAAVFEDVGDKLLPSNKGNARDAYRRAAAAQRFFAGYARSPGETAARLAEADRMAGKAQA